MKKYLVINFILLRPTQLACYAQFQSIISCFMLMLVGLVFGILANYSWGRTLLGRLLNNVMKNGIIKLFYREIPWNLLLWFH